MKKAISPSGTIHFFQGVDVRDAVQEGAPTSLCGVYEHDGAFSELMVDPDDLAAACENCVAAVDGE